MLRTDAACCVSPKFLLPTSYFLLHNTMRGMVETQYDAACCGSTASLQFHTSYFLLHTSYFVSPCVAWWRRSTTQFAAARLRLYNFTLPTSLPTSCFILHTSYHHAWHGGDAVRRSVLRLDCVSTISHFVSPCVAWWRRSTTQPAAAPRRLYNFTLHTSCFILCYYSITKYVIMLIFASERTRTYEY